MWNEIAVAVTSVLGAVTALLRFGGRSSRMRNRVQRDVDLYKSIPDTFGAKDLLAEHIDSTIQMFVQAERENDRKTTDWQGISVALFLLTICAALGAYLWRADFAIYLEIVVWGALAVLSLTALVGLSSSVRKAPGSSKKSTER